MTGQEVQAALDRAMELVPPEEDGWDEDSQPYAEDAAAAIAYALRARLTGDTQETAWAARRVYEAANHFAIAASGLAPGGQSERDILAQPVVQTELGRQSRDLLELADLAKSAVDASQLFRMRERSEREAPSRSLGNQPNLGTHQARRCAMP